MPADDGRVDPPENRTVVISTVMNNKKPEGMASLVPDFIKAWREEFGEVLTPAQAEREIRRLGELLRLLSRPLPGEPTQLSLLP